jgi:hypothetical protein
VSKLTLVSVAFLFIFGLWYARRVRYRPLKPTWLEVVIGITVTIAGFFAFVWSVYDIKIAAIVTGVLCICFTLTGLPMIYHQHAKSKDWQRETEQELKGDTGPLNATKAMAVHFPTEQRPRSD